jgi:hypothetical protein
MNKSTEPITIDYICAMIFGILGMVTSNRFGHTGLIGTLFVTIICSLIGYGVGHVIGKVLEKIRGTKP